MSSFSDTSTDYSSASNGNTLTALFNTKADAERAVDRLVAAGIPQSSVRLLPGYENDGDLGRTEAHTGFFQSLRDFFIPDEDRYSYAEGLSRGGYLITVSNVSQTYYDQALDILDDEGAIDLDEQEQSWRSEGWNGYQDDAIAADSLDDEMPISGTTISQTQTGFGTSGTPSFVAPQSRGTDEVIPVVEEELRVGKRDVSHGRVRVRSYVVEQPVNEQVSLREDNVTLERRPVDRELTAGDLAFQDRTIEAEERAEEAVVGKTARVIECIRRNWKI